MASWHARSLGPGSLAKLPGWQPSAGGPLDVVDGCCALSTKRGVTGAGLVVPPAQAERGAQLLVVQNAAALGEAPQLDAGCPSVGVVHEIADAVADDRTESYP